MLRNLVFKSGVLSLSPYLALLHRGLRSDQRLFSLSLSLSLSSLSISLSVCLSLSLSSPSHSRSSLSNSLIHTLTLILTHTLFFSLGTNR
jgi:hypothetical protein